MSLRSSLGSALRLCTRSANASPAVSRRSLTVLHTSAGSKRIAGYRKAPEDYLSVTGTLYPGTDETLKSTKDFLGSEYNLPDDLILQTLTHKSFAHGLKPYNENLSIIGRHFLRLQTFIHATGAKSENPNTVNGSNFDVTQAKIVNLLSATSVTSKVCIDTGISKNIFWKAPNDSVKSDTVYAKTIDALVGAVLFHFGQHKATQFVSEKLLSGPHSLVSLAAKVYK